MKKILSIFLIGILLMSMVACSGKTEEAPPVSEPDVAEDVADAPEEETEVVEVEEESVPETAPTVEEKTFDASLSGMDLLKSIIPVKRDTMKMVYNLTDYTGAKTVTTAYYKGENVRYENDNEAYGMQIVIYNDDLLKTYYYMEGQSTGIEMAEKDDMASDPGYSTEQLLAISEEYGDDVSIGVDLLDGEEVIVMESTMVEEGQTMVAKVWYSPKYGMTKKMELYMDDQLITTMIVEEIEINIPVDDTLFTPPEGITFTTYSFDD